MHIGVDWLLALADRYCWKNLRDACFAMCVKDSLANLLKAGESCMLLYPLQLYKEICAGLPRCASINAKHQPVLQD